MVNLVASIERAFLPREKPAESVSTLEERIAAAAEEMGEAKRAIGEAFKERNLAVAQLKKAEVAIVRASNRFQEVQKVWAALKGQSQ